MDPLRKGTASELSSPGSTAGNAAASPALLPAAAMASTAATEVTATLATAIPATVTAAATVTSVGFSWSDATGTTPALSFPALEGLTVFDSNPWISNPSLGSEAGLSMYNEYVVTTSAPATPGFHASTTMPNYHHHHHLQPQLQHGSLTVPDFTAAMSDWPGLEDHGSRDLLAMMGNAGSMDVNFDPGMLHTAAQNGSLDPNFGLDFPSLLHPSLHPPQLGTPVSHKQHVESQHGSATN
ncbi:hypothetical protein NQ176_g2089 [Zarea fungicola]|uniref:Uncharacterized protein n=1 Tax=Zarea fungicola TaxID=93591 RepID=A0ACC1NQX7_9HYPO|nr:hypothetical protein NQ176_g2089 [Lecanicillium fungicola]